MDDGGGHGGAGLGGGDRHQGGAGGAVAVGELARRQRPVAEAGGRGGVLVVGQEDGAGLEGVAGVGGDRVEGRVGATSHRRQRSQHQHGDQDFLLPIHGLFPVTSS